MLDLCLGPQNGGMGIFRCFDLASAMSLTVVNITFYPGDGTGQGIINPADQIAITSAIDANPNPHAKTNYAKCRIISPKYSLSAQV